MPMASELGIVAHEGEVEAYLMGTIMKDYREMIRILGKAHFGQSGDKKADVEWVMRVPEGGTFAVWNFKNGPAWNGIAEDSTLHRHAMDAIGEWSVWWNGEGAEAALRSLFGAAFYPHETGGSG